MSAVRHTVRWVLAEFATPDAALAATRELTRAGVPGVDLHSPYPLHDSDEALGLSRPRLIPALALAGAVIGGTTGYLVQWWTNAVDYPLLVGARPPHAPPAFAPITFELAVLTAGLFLFFGLIAVWRFPRLHHPVFEDEAFRSASLDAFWVTAPAADGLLERLQALGARYVRTVESAE